MNFDIPAASRRGIIVMNTPFGNSITTAEHAIALIFAVARDDKAGLASWADQIQRLAEVFDVDAVRVAMADPRLDDWQRTSVFLSLVQPPVDKTLTTFV